MSLYLCQRSIFSSRTRVPRPGIINICVYSKCVILYERCAVRLCRILVSAHVLHHVVTNNVFDTVAPRLADDGQPRTQAAEHTHTQYYCVQIYEQHK